MEKGNEHNFTSKQEFKSFFSPMASFSWENKKKVQGKGFEPQNTCKNKTLLLLDVIIIFLPDENTNFPIK